MRSYIGALLYWEGFDIVEASGGNEAWTLITKAEARPDIIISDIQMPDGDGYSLAKSVHESFPQLPVLLISGSSDLPTDIEFEFLEKPFRPDALLQAVRKLVH